jgi:release factor glutamine methyltransferase
VNGTNLAIPASFLHNQAVLPAAATPPRQPTWTILEVLRWTQDRFAKHGIESARLDAELLAAHAFALSRVELYMHFDRPLVDHELAAYRELVRRRLAGEPVAYILGRKEFWSLDLQVDPRVLVPRPDSETLVEQALDLLKAMPEQARARRIADIGTGSGALALALKKERPGDEIYAVDVSADALAVATANAERLGLAVTFLQGNLVEPLATLAPFDLVISNPPYIPSADIAGLSAEVRCEPRQALDGGTDGLTLVRQLATATLALLEPTGALALEVGAGQANDVKQILFSAGYAQPGSRRDLAGIERVVFAPRISP